MTKRRAKRIFFRIYQKLIEESINFKEVFILGKRIIAVFTVFCLLTGIVCLRLYVVSSTGTELVSSASHYSSFTLGNIRGAIVDCKGRKITEAEYDNYAIAKPTAGSLSVLSKILDSYTYQTVRHNMEKGSPAMINLGKQKIPSTDDILCVPVYKRYDGAAQHILGYLNETGHGVTGLEKEFDEILFTGETSSARVLTDAYGRTIAGNAIELTGGSSVPGRVKLTIDIDIQRSAEKALDSSGIAQGCALVIDVKSGAIKATVSRPLYNAEKISDCLNSDASPFLNRCTSGFAVGSVFKAAVAAAAIENGVDDFQCECNGSCNVDGVVFKCSENTSHGKVNLQKALEKSCNTYFVRLGQKIGAEALLEIASLLGFGQENSVTDEFVGDAGVLPTEEELKNPAALANFSFGQGSFTATPLQIAQMMCAAANKGRYYEPYLVESATDKNGKVRSHKKQYPVVAMSESTSEILLKMLTSVVENGNAASAKPEKFSAAGKTATAQTGIFNSDGAEICNTWFAGCFPADEPKYVAVVMKQGGASGSFDCAPVFKKIADSIKF